jgi:hypothetical protein
MAAFSMLTPALTSKRGRLTDNTRRTRTRKTWTWVRNSKGKRVRVRR